MFRRRRFLVFLSVTIAFLFAIAVTHPFWLSTIGNYFVESQTPAPSDAIVVLAGDYDGERVMKAAELAQQGFAPTIFLGGAATIYGHRETDLGVAFITAHGYPASLFVPIVLTARSTEEEAAFYREELSRRKIRRVLLVTSNYHTRRALEIFRRVLGPDFTIHIVAARNRDFEPGNWWRTREGRKVAFIEGSKTIAVWLGGG